MRNKLQDHAVDLLDWMLCAFKSACACVPWMVAEDVLAEDVCQGTGRGKDADTGRASAWDRQPPPQSGGQIRPTSLPICSADLLGFWDFADSFFQFVGISRIQGHLTWRSHCEMCIIYFGTLDNTSHCLLGSVWSF